jgi:ribosomal-protein-alanine N-acetyltransferase
MFTTERLLLRPFAESDIEAIYGLVYGDAAVRGWWSGYRGDLEDFRSERFRSNPNWQIRDGWGYWALVRRADGQLLGLMGFQNHRDNDMSWLAMPDGSRDAGQRADRIDAELTYALGQPFWRQGYGAEAGRVLIPFGFERLGIDRIINAIDPRNDGSRRLMGRLGFVFVDNGNPDDRIGVLERPAPSYGAPSGS